MKKIKQLQLDNPNLNIDLINILHTLFNDVKYMNMIVNIVKDSFNKQLKDKDVYIDELFDYFGISKEYLLSLPAVTVNLIHHFCFVIISPNNFTSIQSFIDFNERKLTNNRDITSYKTIDDINNELSMINLNLLDKKLESQIIKLYDDGEWMVLKPLTHNASLKYGYGSKWCTASKNDSSTFSSYASNGSLIYCINKKKPIKIAAYKSINNYNPEISFWDSEDRRVDSLFLNIPTNILEVIKKDFNETSDTIYDLMSDELKKRNRFLYGKKRKRRSTTTTTTIL